MKGGVETGMVRFVACPIENRNACSVYFGVTSELQIIVEGCYAA